ncbi:MAG: hypothetical protein K1X51_02110 [Rhodospirillaceae bacterium]|nr:hypothetical protein [Rhodospirillaceae bacterium]
MTILKLEPIVEMLRRKLRAPGLDVAAAAEAGRIIVCGTDVPAGYVGVVSVPPDTIVAVAADLHYRLTRYADPLAVIEKYRADGGTDFHEILSVLRRHSFDGNLSERKVAKMNPERVNGYEIIDRPHMGRIIRMRRDMSPLFHQMFLQQILAPHVTDDLDAVLDVGCGYGDLLAELAAETPRTGPAFFGGEVALPGVACLRHFAEMLGRDNLRGVELDIRDPDFEFLRGKKRVLVISHFALVYVAPFSPDFWHKLFSVVPEVRAVLMEPFSFSVPELAPEPLFTRERAQFYGIAQNFFEVMRELEKGGEIEITEVVPDITGLTTNSTISLLRFRRTPR